MTVQSPTPSTRPRISPARRTGGRRRWRITPAADRATVAIVLHRPDTAAGLLLDVLRNRGVEPDLVRPHHGDPLPDPDGLDIAVLIGADARPGVPPRPWSPAEGAWLRTLDAAGTPILGIGTGAEALAVALGGGAEPARRAERGWIAVATAAPALVAPGPWLAWSENELVPPPGAAVLAENAVGPQVFRSGPHLAVQFHPEATPASVERWIARSGEAVTLESAEAITGRGLRPIAGAARTLLGGFIDSAP
jgi:GMP synthase-like glutamine amidotransferase